MRLLKRRKAIPKPTKIDTIVVIGNGFDRWQGLNTSYSDFQNYYLKHRDTILKKLRIKKYVFEDVDGTAAECTDAELIYGDPFEPGDLDSDFWNNFEKSLADIDAERLNLFFGKEKSDLKKMEKSVRNAKKILTEAFCGWIASIKIDQKDAGFHFGDNCVFINFNYTDTLQKRFGVDDAKEFHIHGEATDKKSIIFGHNKHPQEPEYMLARLGGRFRGLYYIDKVLYETDKHCQDNIQLLCMFLAMHGVMCEDVKDIYVLGQSMSPVDIEYFDFLVRSSKIASEKEDDTNDEPDEMADLDGRMQYVIDKVGYGRETSEEAINATVRKMQQEQQARNEEFQKQFMKMIGKPSKHPIQKSVSQRLQDAKWHISFFGDKDREWKEIVMRELGCTNYQLYPSIDECIGRWREGE